MDKLETYITSTAPNFKQPIADAVIKLFGRSVGNNDLDYVFSGILLSVAMFEAYMVRAAYLKHVRPVSESIVSPVSFADKAVQGVEGTGREIMRKDFSAYGEEGLKEVDEVYVLRDVLTHNHLWQYTLDPEGTQHLDYRLFGGNKNFKQSVDFTKTPIQTKTLYLPVVPGDQTRQTFKNSYSALWRALIFVSREVPHIAQIHSGFRVQVPLDVSRRFCGPETGISVQLHDLVDALPVN